MVTKLKNYEVFLDEDDYFDDDLFSYRSFLITKDEAKTVSGVISNEAEDDFALMKSIFDQMDSLLNLPLVAMLPEPLRTVVKEQEQTTYGMLFYDNEKGFPFTEKDLELLDKQISEYDLGSFIEVNPDVSEGDSIISCYMSLCTCFNFLEPSLLSQEIIDATRKWLKKKDVEIDLSELCTESIFESWSYNEIEKSKAEFFGELIDTVEDFLEEAGVNIPSKDRDIAIANGENPEGLALIYGEDYDYLADAFTKILHITR